METKDHYSLSRLLARRMKLNFPKSLAFTLGNVFPDLNLLSYLKGASAADLDGHTYQARRNLMSRTYSSEFRDTLQGWFHAGEMMHYIADSFTRPHNKEFKFSFPQHVLYERRLHSVFRKTMRPEQILRPAKPVMDIRRFDPWMETLHERYLLSSSAPEDDCRYILRSSLAVCSSLTAKCTGQKPQPEQSGQVRLGF
ncbi:zinc dependent phospholipase C family protein [Anaerostipes sp.]|uniref:zinc dependent phospholipase C family protein n=1 Tax=Anaerostipes sp. TaxID=1872530 RepID=UPI0025BF0354|nr:zinc dependent phospholipase C family protein [Anaerostipes sp.]MBS7009234.1 zinc dependent phospholipase C family protein [Anaerostipes sp.]